MQRATKAWGLSLVALSASLALHFGCSSEDAAVQSPTPDGGKGGGEASVPVILTDGFDLLAPLDGELAEPGATIDVVVGAPAKVTPRVFLGDQEVPALSWIADPSDATILHAAVALPATPGDLRLLVTADNANTAYATLHVVAPTAKAGASLATDPDAGDGGADTVLTLPSGATLRVPFGSVQGGGSVTFASFAPAAIPDFTRAPLVDSILRVHFDADDTAVHYPLQLTEAVPAPVVAALGEGDGLTLRVYEGRDGASVIENEDQLLGPVVLRADLAILADGSGVATVQLPPDAFHHTGSSTAIVGLFPGALYPYKRSATSKLCASNDDDDAGTVNCALLADSKGSPPSVALSNAGDGGRAHVKITSDITWADAPPDLDTPLKGVAAPSLKSPMNPLRETCRNGADKIPCSSGGTTDAGVVLSDSRFRPHEGADIGAAFGDEIVAPTEADATLTMTNSFYVDLVPTGSPNYMLRMMHVSDFTADYTATLKSGDVIGKKASCVPKKNASCDVTAPSDGVYGLQCEETPQGKGKKGQMEKLICHPTLNGALLADPDYCLGQVERGLFTAHFAKGATVGKVGNTGLPFFGPHLHMEVHYSPAGYDNTGSAGRGAIVDPALFYPTLAKDPWMQGGDVSNRVQSPSVEFAAELTPGDGKGPLAGAILGVDSTTLQNSATTACPYGGSIDAMSYRVVKIGGPKEKTTIQWDLGPCVYAKACAASTDVTVQLGTASFRNDNHGSGRPWKVLGSMPGAASYPPDMLAHYTNPPPTVLSDLKDLLTATVTCNSTTPQPSDFEGMQVTVQGTAEFATSTMTITGVTNVGSPSQYVGSFKGPEAGNPNLLSKTVPATAVVFSFGDNAQPAGVQGFPATFTGNNFANRNGRSNLIAVWQDNAKNWQWAFNVSGGSYNSGGGFPQWHEYQFVYNSALVGPAKNRYDVFLGANAQAGGWSYIRTLPTTVAVVRKKTAYVLPDATMK